MTRSLLSFAAFALALGLVPLRAQTPTLPDAEKLLDAADEKIAPNTLRATLRTLAVKGGFKAPMVPKEAHFEELQVGMSRVHHRVVVPGMGEMSSGATPEYCWSTDPAMGVEVGRGERSEPVRRLFGFGFRLPWRELFVAARCVGETSVEGTPCFELEMKPKRGKSERWFLGRKSGLVAAMDVPMPDFQGGTLTLRYLYSDWKPAGGVLFPHRKILSVGTTRIEYRVTSVKWNATLDPARLAPPAAVLKAAKKPVSDASLRKPMKAGECRVVKLEERAALTIRLKVPAAQISRTLAMVLPEVMGRLQALGETPAGPPFTRYHAFEGELVDLEAGIPTRKVLEGKGRIKSSKLPGGSVAMTWHHGPYQLLRKSHEVLERWMKSKELKAGAGAWEVYWTDPGIVPDPKDWRTQILCPIRP